MQFLNDYCFYEGTIVIKTYWAKLSEKLVVPPVF